MDNRGSNSTGCFRIKVRTYQSIHLRVMHYQWHQWLTIIVFIVIVAVIYSFIVVFLLISMHFIHLFSILLPVCFNKFSVQCSVFNTTRWTSPASTVSRFRLVPGWGLHVTEISAACRYRWAAPGAENDNIGSHFVTRDPRDPSFSWPVRPAWAVTHDPVPDHGLSRSRQSTNHDEFTTIAFSSLQWCAIWNSENIFF